MTTLALDWNRIEELERLAAPAPDFAIGQRVRVTRGGHRGEIGTVYDIRPRWDDPDDDGPVVVVNLQTLMLFYGSRRCLEVAPA